MKIFRIAQLRDISDLTDRDIGPFYTADEEEDALLGQDEPELSEDEYEKEAYSNGHKEALGRSEYEDMSKNAGYWCRPPYRTDTDMGRRLDNAWRKGYWDALKSIGISR